MSAGEAVGDAVFAWCRDALGVRVERDVRPDRDQLHRRQLRSADAGRRAPAAWAGPIPGHRVAVIDDDGRECPRGTPGDVAAAPARRATATPDPMFFLGYWKQRRRDARQVHRRPDDSWCRTGDTAVMDDDGYLWYQGRSDDVFKAAGYRIGPSEIENCLVKHPAVANAAVVPKPDAERGALVKAYVVLGAGLSSATRALDRGSCRRTCAASSRPTSTRRRSSSSTPCR